MTDFHLRILRMIARQRERERDDHDSVEHTGDKVSAGRRRDLDQVAERTKANVAAAEARRRFPRAVRGR